MAKKSTQDKIADPPNVLYVVLHGLICLIDKPGEGFTGHLLDRKNEHAYMGGNFGKEQDIGDREALRFAPNCLDTGAATLDPTKNAVLKKAQVKNGAIFAQSTILLPRPNKIYHFVCGSVNNRILQDPASQELQAQPSFISGTRVFEYSFKDYTQVKILRGDGKTPFWPCPQPTMINTPMGQIAVAVFQLYNEPPDDQGGAASIQHSFREFTDSLIFAQAKNIKLTTAVLKPAEGDQLPPGLTADKVCALAVRNKVAALLKKPARKNNLVVKFGKNLGGGGGTQVCGGINGIFG